MSRRSLSRRTFLQTVAIGAAGASVLGNAPEDPRPGTAPRALSSGLPSTQPPMLDVLDRSKLHFVDVAGVRTRYYEAGAGEPMLLLHGGGFGPGYSLDAWSMVLPLLARDFHVYALDRLGQGQTDNPMSLADYSFDGVYQHILAFMRLLDLRRAHLVGHSRGGLFAAHVALRESDLVRTLVLIDSSTLAGQDPPFYGNLPQVPGPSRESVRVEPEAQSFSWAHITDDFVGRLLENAQLPKTIEAQRTMAQGAAGPFNASLSEAREQAHEMIDATGFSMPTLIIWALNDVSAAIRSRSG
jgi:2-hydroxy-6-oxonona-2,4-dienedioate hydrolase